MSDNSEKSDRTDDRTYQEREAVALFDSEKTLNAAVDELMQNGVDQADLSVLADPSKLKQETTEQIADDDGAVQGNYEQPYTRTQVLTAMTSYPALVTGLGAAVIAGGTMGAAMIPMLALVAGSTVGGGAIGFMLARLYGHKHAELIQEQIKDGGILLWVRANDPKGDKQKVEILSRHGGRAIHFHVAHRTWGVGDIPYFNPDPLIKG